MLNWFILHSPLFYFFQSLWRDEAFSVLVAERPLSTVLGKLTFEPPVYYILLHFWIKIFGESEIAARSLSLLGVALATIIIIYWSEKLFKKHWLTLFLPVFIFINPMLIYYAFEIRTYGWYIFFAVLSMFSYLEKRWILYIVSGVLGFYTHTFFGTILLVEAVHWVVFNRQKFLKIKLLFRDPLVKSMFITGLFIIPWLLKITASAGQLKNSWYFPVNLNLVYSVLGNMFLGYEGTPGGLWGKTALLSLVLMIFFIIAVLPKKTRSRNLFFFLQIIVPLGLVIGISFIKPFFVNRYLIGVSVAEVILLTLALETIRNNLVQKTLALLFIAGVILFNVWYPQKHPKLDIRSTIKEINILKNKNDVILANSPLILFESIYYAGDRSRVYLFNPNHSPFPWYVGDAIVSSSIMTDRLPDYPVKAFVVNADGTYTVTYMVPILKSSANPALR